MLPKRTVCSLAGTIWRGQQTVSERRLQGSPPVSGEGIWALVLSLHESGKSVHPEEVALHQRLAASQHRISMICSVKSSIFCALPLPNISNYHSHFYILSLSSERIYDSVYVHSIQ